MLWQKKMPVRRPRGEREARAELGDRDVHALRAIAEVALHAGGERLADAQARLHDPFAVDLREVVVGEEEVDLVGEVALQFRGLVEHLPGAFAALLVEVIAVDQLLQDEVPLRVVAQVGGGDESCEIVAMVVDVAGDPDLALAGQVDDLLVAQRVELVLLGGGLRRSRAPGRRRTRRMRICAASSGAENPSIDTCCNGSTIEPGSICVIRERRCLMQSPNRPRTRSPRTSRRASEPFDQRRLCHLLRRRAFGATPRAARGRARTKSPCEVVDWLLEFRSGAAIRSTRWSRGSKGS